MSITTKSLGFHNQRVIIFTDTKQTVERFLNSHKDTLNDVEAFYKDVRARGKELQDCTVTIPSQEKLKEDRRSFLEKYEGFEATLERVSLLAHQVKNTIQFLTPVTRNYTEETQLKERVPELYVQIKRSEEICLEYIVTLREFEGKVNSLKENLVTSITKPDLTWSIQRFCQIVDNKGNPLPWYTRSINSVTTPVVPKIAQSQSTLINSVETMPDFFGIDITIKYDVGDGNTLGICCYPNWIQAPISFTCSEEGWSGQLPVDRDWKFVILKDGQVIAWEVGLNRHLDAKTGPLSLTSDDVKFPCDKEISKIESGSALINSVETVSDSSSDSFIDITIKYDVSNGNTLGVCYYPNWIQEPISFTHSEAGWSGELPLGRDFKFVILKDNQVVAWELGLNRRFDAKTAPLSLTNNDVKFPCDEKDNPFIAWDLDLNQRFDAKAGSLSLTSNDVESAHNKEILETELNFA